ncbi:MAG: hypothetical protein ACOYOV_13985 [Bacteroidales bacterium]
MLGDFFRINLPYGIARNENGEWMAFNREYLPLGFIDQSLKGMPGKSYLDLPVYTYYKNVTEKLLLQLADDDTSLQRNDSNEIVKVFFYSDGTNPRNHIKDNDILWNKYFAKLKILSKLKRNDMA